MLFIRSSNRPKKNNILVVFGDDIGVPQISAYSTGMMGYWTPNIDSIARQGVIFSGQQINHAALRRSGAGGKLNPNEILSPVS